jgi:hypothetical protein
MTFLVLSYSHLIISIDTPLMAVSNMGTFLDFEAIPIAAIHDSLI